MTDTNMTTEQRVTLSKQLDVQSKTQSPMALLRRLTDCGAKADGQVLYFDSRQGVRGPGYGKDIPELLEALDPVQQALEQVFGGDGFFISMIPSRFIRFISPSGPDIPDFADVPDFFAFFDPIRRVLKASVPVPCEVDIEVVMEERWKYSYSPRLVLRITESESRKSVSPKKLGIQLDMSSQACQALVSWFAGCSHGLVSWKPVIRVDAPLLNT